MSFEGLSDADIKGLINSPKRALNASRAKVKSRAGVQHDEWTVKLQDEEGGEFTFYTRQNRLLDRDFSCGLIWASHEGDLPLLRLNGSGHVHPPLGLVCHIHRATEKAIREGRKPDAYAEATSAYDSLDGAKHVLVTMASIMGVPSEPPQPKLL